MNDATNSYGKDMSHWTKVDWCVRWAKGPSRAWFKTKANAEIFARERRKAGDKVYPPFLARKAKAESYADA